MTDNVVGITVTAKDQTAAALDSVDKRIKKIGDTTKGILSVVTADFFQGAANSAKQFVSSTVAAASDLGESANAVNKTFGESAKVVADWGEQNAAAFGLSKRAFNEAITPLGALLKNTGLDMQTVGQDTIDLTKRAADMASVFNTSVPDALEAIQAGLRGESDPLERFGVSLSAAAVEAEALAASGKKSASELTNAEKATARINLIMKQTASTAGDFADTTDGLANSARVAGAQIEDAKAKIGEGLLPILAKGAQLAGQAAEGFGQMPAPIQKAALVLGLLAAGFVYLAPKIMAAKVALSEAREAVSNMDGRMGRLAKTAITVGAALAVVQAASAAFGHSDTTGVDATTDALNKLATSGQRSSEVTKHLDYDLGTLGSGGAAKAGNAVAGTIESLTGLGSVMDESLQHAKERIASIDAAMAALVASGNADEAAQLFDLLAQRAQEQGISVDDLKKGLPQYADALAAAGHKAEDTANETRKATEEFDALGATLGKIKDPLSAVDTAMGVLLGHDRAVLGFAESLTKLGDALKENGHHLELNTEKGQANREAILGGVEANIKAYDSNVQSGMGAEEAARQYDINTAALEAQMRTAGFTAAEIDNLIGKYRGVPGNITTDIALHGLAEAINGLDETLRLLNHLPPRKDLYVVTHYSSTGHQTAGPVRGGFEAHGGIVGAASGGIRGAMTWVGEQGPELIQLPPGTMVHPHGTSVEMERQAARNGASPGGGGEIVFGGDLDGAVAQMFMRLVREKKITIRRTAIVGG